MKQMNKMTFLIRTSTVISCDVMKQNKTKSLTVINGKMQKKDVCGSLPPLARVS